MSGCTALAASPNSLGLLRKLGTCVDVCSANGKGRLSAADHCCGSLLARAARRRAEARGCWLAYCDARFKTEPACQASSDCEWKENACVALSEAQEEDTNCLEVVCNAQATACQQDSTCLTGMTCVLAGAFLFHFKAPGHGLGGPVRADVPGPALALLQRWSKPTIATRPALANAAT